MRPENEQILTEQIKSMSDPPKRIQRKRTKGWKMPPNTVAVDRSSRWGNPFVIWNDDGAWTVSNASQHHLGGDSKAEAQQIAVDLFRQNITDGYRTDAIKALRGKNLACYCQPGSPCHADVLIELVNGKL